MFLSRLALLVFVASLLAGCTKAPDTAQEAEAAPLPDPGPIRDGNGSALPPIPSGMQQPEYVDCTAMITGFVVDPVTLRLMLPEGFTPGGLFAPALASINLEYYTCRAVILDNATVLHNVSQSMVVALVNVPEELESPNSVDVFLFEWLTDSQEFHDFAVAQGAPMGLAEITLDISDDTDGEASVVVEGDRWYQSTTLADSSEASPDPRSSRKHHYFQDGQNAWMFRNGTVSQTEDLLRSSSTQVNDGFLLEFAWAHGGLVAGVAQYTEASGSFSFGRMGALA